MFEQLDQPKRAPQVSIATSLGIFVAYLVGAFGGLCLFIALEGASFGIQIATAITYTYFAFWYVFFPTRGMLEKYSLRNKSVQQQIPRLLVIHCTSLAFIFVVLTVWFEVKSRLPHYWLAELGKQHDTLYVLVMLGCITIVFFAQVFISRRILSRSVEAPPNKSGLDLLN